MKHGIALTMLILLTTFTIISAKEKSQSKLEATGMKIVLRCDTGEVSVTMNDSPAARDFISRLPLTLTFEDYARTEKISYLPDKLTVKGAPDGCTPSRGDITYYAPWGNLAIFYRDFKYSAGLILLGRLDADASILEKWRDKQHVLIERAKNSDQ